MAGWGFAGESVIHLYNFCDVRLGLTYHILFLMKAKKQAIWGCIAWTTKTVSWPGYEGNYAPVDGSFEDDFGLILPKSAFTILILKSYYLHIIESNNIMKLNCLYVLYLFELIFISLCWNWIEGRRIIHSINKWRERQIYLRCFVQNDCIWHIFEWKWKSKIEYYRENHIVSWFVILENQIWIICV